MRHLYPISAAVPGLFGLILLLAPASPGRAQQPRVNPLPEFVYVPPAPDRAAWERVLLIKGRTMYGNTIACTDSTVYSFGGFGGNKRYTEHCSYRVFREMNRIEGGRLARDSISYPGKGFMWNVFFIRDSIMYIGGGHDSCESRYSWNDFWQYNMRTQSWKRLADLPFYYHRPPFIFTEGGRVIALITQVYGEDFRQATPRFYEYEPESDRWTVISGDMPSEEAEVSAICGVLGAYLRPVAFRVGDEVFVLMQRDVARVKHCSHAFYKFNLSDRSWSPLPAFPGYLETFAFAMSDGMYGYIGGGLAWSTAYRKEVYRYDPQLRKWERIVNLPRGLNKAVGWHFKAETYVGFGLNDKEVTTGVWKLKQKKK